MTLIRNLMSFQPSICVAFNVTFQTHSLGSKMGAVINRRPSGSVLVGTTLTKCQRLAAFSTTSINVS